MGLGPDTSQVNVLTKVQISQKIIKIACGKYSTSALTESGSLIRWGRRGCCADTSWLPSEARDNELHNETVIDIEHNIIQTESGSVLMDNVRRLFGTKFMYYEQVMTREENFVVSMSSKALNNAVVTKHGTVLTWGRGMFGRLGHGNTENQESPITFHHSAP